MPNNIASRSHVLNGPGGANVETPDNPPSGAIKKSKCQILQWQQRQWWQRRMLAPPQGHRIWKFQWNPNCCCVVKCPPYILPNSQSCNFGTNPNTKYANADQRPSTQFTFKILLVLFPIPIIIYAYQRPSSKPLPKVLLVPFLIPIFTCATQHPSSNLISKKYYWYHS